MEKVVTFKMRNMVMVVILKSVESSIYTTIILPHPYPTEIIEWDINYLMHNEFASAINIGYRGMHRR